MKKMKCNVCGNEILFTNKETMTTCPNCGAEHKLSDTIEENNVQVNEFELRLKKLTDEGFSYLSKEDWEEANIYFERILNQDPSNINSYLGKLLIDLKTKSVDDLVKQQKTFEDNDNFLRIKKLDPNNIGKELQMIIDKIYSKNLLKKLENQYNQYRSQAVSLINYKNFKATYIEIKNLNHKEYYSQAEIIMGQYNESIYKFVSSLNSNTSISILNTTINLLKEMESYKDSKEKIPVIKDFIKKKTSNNENKKKMLVISTSSLIFIVSFIIILFSVIIPNSKYNKAVKKIDTGDYNGALEIFEGLGKHKDTLKYIDYAHGAIYYNSGKYDMSKTIFENIIDFKDSNNFVVKNNNELAKGYLSDSNTYYFGKYPQSVVSDKDLISKINNSNNKNLKGYYEYDGSEYIKIAAKPTHNKTTFVNKINIEENKEYFFKVEPIKWMILENMNNEVTLLADMIVDKHHFYTDINQRIIDGKPVYASNWEYSSIREWLNNDFYNNAFDYGNKTKIKTVLLDNSASTEQLSSNDTNDKVYLLSWGEIRYYNLFKRGIPSDYARANGVHISTLTSGDYSDWWSRTANMSGAYLVYVMGLKDYKYDGFDIKAVQSDSTGVRPVITISLN